MAADPRVVNTPSILTAGQYNRTGVDLSTNIVIKVGNTSVGAIKSLTVNESRTISQIGELGRDGFIDSVPSGHTSISGNITRVRFDRLRLFNAFGRDFMHLKSQRYPFDIVIIDKNEGDASNYITTTIKNVFFDSLNTTYSDGEWIIQEAAGYKAETIFSTRSGLPVTEGVLAAGKAGIPLYKNFVERTVDGSDIRGSMSAGDLINLVTNGESEGSIF